jgi:hypothetical protein
MWRTLRAFAWMQWRVLMNSLERTGARDTVERLSLAIEQIGPIIALALLAPSALGLAGLGAYAGYWLPGPDRVVVFDAIRVLLLVASGFCVIAPLLIPSMDRTNAVRLLLLPIAPRTLYVAHAAGAFAEPWVLLALAAIVGVSAGLAAAGAFAAALLSLAGGLLLIAVLMGLSTLIASLVHLVFRDRRRGELVALLFIIALPLLPLLTGFMEPQRQTREERRAERRARAERIARGEETANDQRSRIVQRAYALLPSELYVSAARSSAHREGAAAAASLGGLGLSAGILHALGLVTFSSLLRSPGSTSRRKTLRATGSHLASIPGVSRGAMAVAYAQLWLMMRTPRGKAMLLSPLLVFAMIAVLLRRNSGVLDIGFTTLGGGLGLATLSAAMCVLAILPFAMNQFAIDRAGLTLALLAPLDHRDLLVGKGIAHGLIVAGSTVFCTIASWVLLPGGHPAIWFGLMIGVASTYILAAPGAAVLSAVFPRPVDLNSIGRGSNAHGAANFLGMLLFVASGVPSVLLSIAAITLLGRPALAPILLIGWCVVALLLSRVMFEAAAAVFDRRKENLALVKK